VSAGPGGSSPIDDDLAFDPFDPEQTHHLWEVTAALRDRCPVSRPRPGFVYVARHDDNAQVFRDARAFANAGGFREPDVVLPEDQQTLGEMDPPLHPRVRRLLLKAFTPATSERNRPWARQAVRRLVEAFVDRGGGDVVAEITLPLPIAVTAHILGLPDDDVEWVSTCCFEIFNSTWPARNETARGVGLHGAFPEFCAYVDERIAERRSGRVEGDDLISRMIQAEERGERLTDVQIRTLATNVLLGSLSTTLLMANLVHRLIREPEIEARLRADPSRVPFAVEESLRLEPPVILLFRTATRSVRIGGTVIEAGERVITGIASANRDEGRWADAEAFRLDRADGAEHLAFGIGPHQCIGKDVARMEAQELLHAILDLVPPGGLALAPGFHYEFVPHFLEYGPEHLAVVVRRATGGPEGVA
jgi:cytochrome P450